MEKENKKDSQSLAERCYSSENIEDELFESVNKILGCDTNECLKDQFVWGATDTWWDQYDGSVEITRPLNAEYMTGAQADAILELGFDLIYESCGDKAQSWTRNGSNECSPREGGDIRMSRIKQKIELKEVKNHLELAWVIIANAGGGDWERESPEWEEAAAKWRDKYYEIISENKEEENL